MKQLFFASLLSGLHAAAAQAGGIERTTQSVGILFEPGRYGEFSFGFADPNVSGRVRGTPLETGGGVLDTFGQISLGVKIPLSDATDIALVLDQPIGADVAYPAAAPYPIAGTRAEVDATAVTLMGRHRLPSGLSVIGGLRALTTSGTVSLPVTTATGLTLPYAMETSTETDWGYLAGVAYERPETALRVALAYNSAIDHGFAAQEVTALGAVSTRFATRIPQSVNLEAQTGIAADTLLLGSIRWVDWSSFDIDPEAYRTLNPANPQGDKLVGYEQDYTTYTLGLGRRLGPAWSGAVSASYEEKSNPLASNLGPVNGYASLNLALSYSSGPVVVTGLLRYIDLTGTQTESIGATFAGNEAWAAGVRVGYRF